MSDVSRVVYELLKDVENQSENLKFVEDFANQGDAAVMYILGWCYLKGDFFT